MLKKSASIVLASLRGSTRVVRKSETLEGFFRSPRSIVRANGPTKCGPYLLASSLTAALLDGLFEHPEAIVASVPYYEIPVVFYVKPRFSAACYSAAGLFLFTGLGMWAQRLQGLFLIGSPETETPISVSLTEHWVACTLRYVVQARSRRTVKHRLQVKALKA